MAPSQALPGGYFDSCAASPPSAAVLAAMAAAQEHAWANPSSLHGPGLAAAESLERSRQRLAAALGAAGEQLLFTSGASESIHLALLGSAACLEPGRLVITTVEHPATLAAAEQLAAQGWTIAQAPVDRQGLLDLQALAALLTPPTRLASLIWGQSEVGALQDIAQAGALCRAAGVPLHVDAVQVVGHAPVHFAQLPVDLLTCTAHKLGGPRGIGLLLCRRVHRLAARIGGAQEGGLRGGTEAVVLAAGFACALDEAGQRRAAHGGRDPLEPVRDRLLSELLRLEGVEGSGPPPGPDGRRLPHHISLLIRGRGGAPLDGRALVRSLWQEGIAASSGSACSSAGRVNGGGVAATSSAATGSPVLRAMGYSEAEARAGLRLCLGPWHRDADLSWVAAALAAAIRRLDASPTPSRSAAAR